MKKLARYISCAIITLAISLSLATEAYSKESEKKEKTPDEKNASKDQEAMKKVKLAQDLEHLTSEEYQFFENAVYNFELMGDEAILPLLNHLKKHDDDEVTVVAVLYTLGRLGKNGARAVPVLIKHITHNNYNIRIAAISALGRIGKPSDRAVFPLKKIYVGSDDWGKHIIKRTLKEIKTKNAKKTLREIEEYEKSLEKDAE